MNNLKDMRCYLVGAIDLAKDKGKGWRNEVTPTLRSFGIKVMDPCRKPMASTLLNEESPEYFLYKQKLKQEERYDELTDLMKPVRSIDLAMVDRSDIILAAIDITIHACGTYEELSWAARCKKPTIVVSAQGKKYLPDWLFAMHPHRLFFNSFVDAFDYLNYIDKTPQDKIETLGRWKFFRLD
jgi:hypothetical protein